MWDIADIKKRGRTAFKANYWPCVIVGFILALVVGGGVTSGRRAVPQSEQTMEIESATDELTTTYDSLTETEQSIFTTAIVGSLSIVSIVGILLKVFLVNPLQVGCHYFFRKNAENPTASVDLVGQGFGAYGRTFLTMFLNDLFIALWTLLFIIPGIMCFYSYALVPYLLKDEPNLTAMQVLRRSKDLMRGNRGRMFLMDLSFIGWYLLTALTLGIAGAFWTFPYVESTHATLYLELTGRSGRHFA